MRPLPWLLAVSAALLACSSSAIPIDQIDQAKKLTDLSSAEKAGLCEWTEMLASEKLPKDGSKVTCEGGVTVTFHWQTCGPGGPVSGMCAAAVKDARACLPAFIDAIGKNPCSVLDLFTVDDVDNLLATLPACKAMVGCAYTL